MKRKASEKRRSETLENKVFRQSKENVNNAYQSFGLQKSRNENVTNACLQNLDNQNETKQVFEENIFCNENMEDTRKTETSNSKCDENTFHPEINTDNFIDNYSKSTSETHIKENIEDMEEENESNLDNTKTTPINKVIHMYM